MLIKYNGKRHLINFDYCRNRYSFHAENHFVQDVVEKDAISELMASGDYMPVTPEEGKALRELEKEEVEIKAQKEEARLERQRENAEKARLEEEKGEEGKPESELGGTGNLPEGEKSPEEGSVDSGGDDSAIEGSETGVVKEEEPEKEKEPKEPEEKGDEQLKCKVCGKVCKSELGLMSHMKSHEKK